MYQSGKQKVGKQGRDDSMKQSCDIPGASLKHTWKLKVLVHAVFICCYGCTYLNSDDIIKE